MQRTLRSTWRNHTGNQSCQPLQVCEPDDLDELVALVGTFCGAFSLRCGLR